MLGTYFRRWKGSGVKHPARSKVYKVRPCDVIETSASHRPVLDLVQADSACKRQCRQSVQILLAGRSSLARLLLQYSSCRCHLWLGGRAVVPALDASLLWPNSSPAVWFSLIAGSSALERHG